MKHYPYVIIGGGIAGVCAAEGIRTLDKSGAIALFSNESQYCYSRPMLTKMPLSGMEIEPRSTHCVQWYQKNEIDVFLNANIDRLDPSEKRVYLGDQTYSFDKCILATGAENFLPPFPNHSGVTPITIRRIEDMRALKRLLAVGKKVVVIGGGVIGLEVSLELARYKMNVTVLEAMEYLMPRLLDHEFAQRLQDSLTTLNVITGAQITELTADREVKLADGRCFPFDVLIVSCGVRANTVLAREAGISCERAIVVNDHMQTNFADIYACGDCAQWNGVNYALWSQAVAQGRTAGINAAGGDQKVSPFDTSVTLNTPEVSMFAAGDLGQMRRGNYTVTEAQADRQKRYQINGHTPNAYEKIVYLDGRPVGAAILGNLSNMQKFHAMIAKAAEEP